MTTSGGRPDHFWGATPRPPVGGDGVCSRGRADLLRGGVGAVGIALRVRVVGRSLLRGCETVGIALGGSVSSGGATPRPPVGGDGVCSRGRADLCEVGSTRWGSRWGCCVCLLLGRWRSQGWIESIPLNPSSLNSRKSLPWSRKPASSISDGYEVCRYGDAVADRGRPDAAG